MNAEAARLTRGARPLQSSLDDCRADRPLIPPRPAPASGHAGPVAWLRRNLFADMPTALATVLVGGLLFAATTRALHWAVFTASWRPDPIGCRTDGVGACWGVIAEKYRLILFGRYPFAEQWRPLAATALLVGMLVLSGHRAAWRGWLAGAWAAALLAMFVLLRGGLLGLAAVETDHWGGLPLTMLLATLSIAMALPIAVAVALGRRSRLPAIRALCAVYVELIRGVPLVTVLFMASFMAPLLMPQGWSVDVLPRVLAGITLFAAAYLAEVVRGGLQALPAGQLEAAAALGLPWWTTQRHVVLPQALTAVLPGIVNSFIAIFKETSLVTIVSLYELTGALGLALNSDAAWRPFKLEGYLFIAAIYFVACLAMSRYSLAVERRLRQAHAR